MIRIIDTETCSLQGGIVQIGYVETNDNLVIKGQRETLVNPEQPISSGAAGIHFINDDMIKDAPVIEDVLPEYLPKEGYLVCHNAPFDIKMMQCQDYLEENNIKVVCTLELARKLYPKGTGEGCVPDHKMGTLWHEFKLYKKYHYEGESHTSKFDCNLTRDVLEYMLEDKGLTIHEAYDLLNLPVQKELCKMKKYRESGKTWEEVLEEDPSYCKWIVDNVERNKYNTKIIEWLEENL